MAAIAVSLGGCASRDESTGGTGVTDVIRQEEGALGSSVMVRYPRMNALPGTPRAALNEAIRRKFMEEFASGCESILMLAAETEKQIEADPEEDGPAMHGWTNQFTYIPDHLSENSVSLSIRSDSYTGGAHGNSDFIPVNYQWTEQGVRQVDLADLFDPSADWKGPVSKLVWREFLKIRTAQMQLTDDYRRKLEGPDGLAVATWGEWKTLENLVDEPFTFSSSGLTFHYAPYVLGSYAAGSFHVLVPIGELRHLLSTAGPMGRWLD